MISSENLLFCVVHHIALFCSHYFIQMIPLGRDNMLIPTSTPWAMGARAKGARPFQYKDHTAWPPLPANFQWVHISNTSLLYVSTLHVPYIERSLVLNSSNIFLKYHRNVKWPPLPALPLLFDKSLIFYNNKMHLIHLRS